MTQKEVEQLIEEFKVPKHVRRHCGAVAAVAGELAKKIQASGEKVDIDLVLHSAALHDLVRVVDFKSFEPEVWDDLVTDEEIEFWKNLRKKYAGRHHADVAAEILRARGFPEEAQIVEQHKFIQIKKGFDSLEAKIVYYADKRVRHDEIVSIAERLEDGRKRNAPETIGTAHAAELEKKVLELEQELLG
ncbi:hypothetical protein COV82_03075 [Candidatus Peregrinibacteria bacterium CG11_big_fil_rev_8_21_14_0_20_46_8]|nr:MAG: hypothetical protein COV82_03075 [Candidatus Peregrinibacteria bacterium CG11_big_fil_rev_8_21_14_0_20_46_8]